MTNYALNCKNVVINIFHLSTVLLQIKNRLIMRDFKLKL